MEALTLGADLPSEAMQVESILVPNWALLRMCAVPYRVLLDAAPAQTWSDVHRLLDIEDRLDTIRDEAVDALHARIPSTVDRLRRRQLLALKRSIHAGKPLALPVTELDSLALPEVVCEWLRLSDEHQHLSKTASDRFASELDSRTRPVLRASLEHQMFAHALGLSAPRLRVKLEQSPEWNWGHTTSTKSERTLMNYLTRACAKTSPLSTFMFNAFVEIDANAEVSRVEAINGPGWRSLAQLNRGVAARIGRHARRNTTVYDNFELTPNRSIRRAGERKVRAMASAHVELLGRPWRQDRIAVFALPDAVVEILEDVEVVTDWREVSRRLMQSGYSSSDAGKWLKQLLANGLLYPAPLWSATSGDPLGALTDSLKVQSSLAAGKLHATLVDLNLHVQRLHDAPVQELEATERAINASVTAANEQVGARFAVPYQSNVSEFAWASGVQGRLGRKFHELMHELGMLLAEHVSVSPEYTRILELFIGRFGIGGSCPDLMAFLMGSYAEFAESMGQPTSIAKVQGASLGVTTYVQLLIPALEALDGGEATMVANLLYERLAWQTCRYLAPGVAYPSDPSAAIESWLRSAASGSEPVELTVSADCNGLQAHLPVTKRCLAWPGEGNEIGLPEQVVDPNLVSVRHDRSSNRLSFFDTDGRPISLMYLGAVMPLLSWGPPYMLVKMSEPLSIDRPYHLLGSRSDGGDVQYQERISQGRIVMLRASWKLRSALLLDLLRSSTGVPRLHQIARIFRQFGIPRTSFVNAIIDYSAVGAQQLNLDRQRKPTWLDIANPICLDLLRRLADSCEWLVFRESLPAAEQHWLRINGECHVSEFQVELHIRMH